MAFTLSSLGDSYTAFSYNSGTEIAIVDTLWGNFKLFNVAEGFAGAFPSASGFLIAVGDLRKGHIAGGIFAQKLTARLPTSYPFGKLVESAVGGTTAEDWSTTIPGPYITNPASGRWAGYAPQLYNARNNNPVVFLTLGGNDIFYQIRNQTGHMIGDNAYFDGTLMPLVEQYLKNIVDYIMWLTGGNPTAGLPGSAEIVLASYVNFSVQDGDGTTVEQFFYTNNNYAGNWNNAIWCADQIGAYADFYSNAGSSLPNSYSADDAQHRIADQRWRDSDWGTIDRGKFWHFIDNPNPPYYYNPTYPLFGPATPWEQSVPTLPISGADWQYITTSAGPHGPAGTVMHGWGMAARNVTDEKVNALFRKLDTVYKNVETWADNKYRKNAVIYCPVWKAVANPAKPSINAEYRSWPRNYFNDSIHLNQTGWHYWLNAVFDQWFPRSTYIPQLNTVSSFSNFMY